MNPSLYTRSQRSIFLILFPSDHHQLNVDCPDTKSLRRLAACFDQEIFSFFLSWERRGRSFVKSLHPCGKSRSFGQFSRLVIEFRVHLPLRSANLNRNGILLDLLTLHNSCNSRCNHSSMDECLSRRE